ncbi:TPA: helix-turn-helix transcriptional regulator [Streptococcus pyogenes]|nr:helix-turn-helix transcriptional regulator [Streptococcus pyogenes]
MLKKRPACPVETTLSVIGNKWKLLILRDLLKGTLRFGQLKSSIGSVSQKVLTAQLRAMEADGLVHREVYAEVPPRVEYSLTETGLSLAPVIEAMSDWDQTYQEKHADLFEEGQRKELPEHTETERS